MSFYQPTPSRGNRSRFLQDVFRGFNGSDCARRIVPTIPDFSAVLLLVIRSCHRPSRLLPFHRRETVCVHSWLGSKLSSVARTVCPCSSIKRSLTRARWSRSAVVEGCDVIEERACGLGTARQTGVVDERTSLSVLFEALHRRVVVDLSSKAWTRLSKKDQARASRLVRRAYSFSKHAENHLDAVHLFIATYNLTLQQKATAR